MVSIVISEETSEVTLFRDGRFIESYDPYTDKETPREEKVVPMKRKESSEGSLGPRTPTGSKGDLSINRVIERDNQMKYSTKWNCYISNYKWGET